VAVQMENRQRAPLDKRTVIGALLDGHIDEGLGYDFFIEDPDDGVEVKVAQDQTSAEKGPRGRYMKEYGPADGPGDDDWGQGEAMAEGTDWQHAMLGQLLLCKKKRFVLRQNI